MDSQQQDILLIIAARTLRFATDHPYAAPGIFGAMLGSAATYKAVKFHEQRQKAKDIFTPKAYDIVLPPEELRRLANDPSSSLRCETIDVVVVVTAEKREPLRQLPDIDGREVA